VTNLPHVIHSIFAQTIHALFEGNVRACVRMCMCFVPIWEFAFADV